MSKLFKFNEEDCECPQCELVEGYTELILDAESVEELKHFLSLAIEDAVELGFKQALLADINHKVKVLDSFDECEFCDDECDCQ